MGFRPSPLCRLPYPILRERQLAFSITNVTCYALHSSLIPTPQLSFSHLDEVFWRHWPMQAFCGCSPVHTSTLCILTHASNIPCSSPTETSRNFSNIPGFYYYPHVFSASFVSSKWSIFNLKKWTVWAPGWDKPFFTTQLHLIIYVIWGFSLSVSSD